MAPPACTSPSLYSASENQEFSLGDAFLSKYVHNGQSELSTTRFLQTPLAWTSVVHFRGAWEKLGRIWLSLLVSPGTIIYNSDRDRKQAWLALQSSVVGLYCMRLDLNKVGDLWYVTVPSET